MIFGKLLFIIILVLMVLLSLKYFMYFYKHNDKNYVYFIVSTVMLFIAIFLYSVYC